MIKKMEAAKWWITYSSSKSLWDVRFGGKVLCLECMACPKIQLHKTERKKQWKSPCAGACVCNYHHHYHLVLLLQWTNFKKGTKKEQKAMFFIMLRSVKCCEVKDNANRSRTKPAPSLIFLFLFFQLLYLIILQNLLVNLLTIIIVSPSIVEIMLLILQIINKRCSGWKNKFLHLTTTKIKV